MDLSFARFQREADVSQLPADLAVLMVGIAARQAASATAACQAGLSGEPADARLFAPGHGAFHAGVATALAGWRDE